MSVDQFARSNNQQLFNLYAKKLCSDDVDTFSEVAQKLALWLNNGKAYYDEARPEIVKLLMIAQSTLRRAVGATDLTKPFHVSQYDSHGLVLPYTKLVQIVGGFMHLFVEKELEVGIRYLVNTINPPPSQGASKLYTKPEQISPVIPTAQISGSFIPSNGSKSLVKSDPAALGMDHSLPPEKGTMQKIKRKRKILEHLIDVDLRKFRETATSSVIPGMVQKTASPSVNQEVSCDIGTDIQRRRASEPSEITLPPNLSRKSSDLSQAAHFVPPKRSTVNPNPTTHGLSEGEATSSNALLHESKQKSCLDMQPVTSPEQVMAETPMPTEGQLSTCAVSTQHDRQLPGGYDVKKATIFEHFGTGYEYAPALPPPAIEKCLESSGDEAVLFQQVDCAETGTSDTNDQCEDVSRDGVQGLEIPGVGKISAGYSETSTHATILEKIQELHTKLSLYVSAPVIGDRISQPSSNESCMSDAEEVASREFRSLLGIFKDTPMGACVDTTDASEVPHVKTHTQLNSIMDEDIMECCSLERFKVAALLRGLRNPGKVTISLNIKPAVHLALARWTERSSLGISNLKDAFCATLRCYRATEKASSVIADKRKQSWEEFVSSHRSLWPQTGGLQLSLIGGRRYNLPLSPPLAVTPDGLFDMSHLFVVGANSFELRSNRDMSKYIFALVVHPPTPQQLSLHREHCKKEQDWKHCLTSLLQPFDVDPFLPLPQ